MTNKKISATAVNLTDPTSLFVSLDQKMVAGHTVDVSGSFSTAYSTLSGLAPIATHRLLTESSSFMDQYLTGRGATVDPTKGALGVGLTIAVGENLADKVREHEAEILRLRASLRAEERNVKKNAEESKRLQDDATALSTERDRLKNESDRLTETLEVIRRKEKVHQFLSRVSDDALENLMNEGSLATEFLKDEARSCFVMSVDIRRSTDLMLKARSPELFAKFITKLCEEMRAIVIGHYGVFDKFTGDGILAFFPDFYAGPDSALQCVRAATACHLLFDQIYKEHRSSFSSIFLEVGLGIGIDYGMVKIVQIGKEMTVVGVPVVYACRLGGSPAGSIFLNQPAFERLSKDFRHEVRCKESRISFKHEGDMLAYSTELIEASREPAKPEWTSL